MLKIGFDLSQTAHQGGVATYTSNLASELAKNKELEMVFFYSSLRQQYKGGLKNVKKFKLPPTLFEVLFNRIRSASIEKFLGPLDIFHSSDWVQPPSKAKKVTTYHDVVPLKFPQWSTPKIVAVHKRRLQIVESEIDVVIAVSEATKKDLLEISSIPENKIKVVYEGVSPIFKPSSKEDVESFRKKYNLPEEFVLAIGGIGERRNLKRVKEACKNYNLIITGESIPKIPDEEMPLLYGAATVLLYPSFYEGFGLPIVEAMACGLPVITSNVSSMPEVGGGAVLYVNPNSLDEIKGTLKSLMVDKELQASIRKKGFEQANKFSWEKVGEETVEVYKNLLSYKKQ